MSDPRSDDLDVGGSVDETATQVFIHSLLERRRRGGPSESLVNRAFDRWRDCLDDASESAASASDRSSPVKRWGPLATAAGTMIIVLVTWALTADDTDDPDRESTIARAIRVASDERDRTYSLTVDVGGGEGRGTLHVRGRDHFVLQLAAPPGNVVIGRDGGEPWFIPPNPSLPVLTNFDGIPFLGGFLGDVDSLHFDAAQLLVAAERHCDRVTETKTETTIDVEAHVRDGADTLLRTIRFSIRRSDGVLLSLEATTDGGPGPRAVRFELESEEQRGHAFYGHARHHEEGRPVERRPDREDTRRKENP